MLSGDENQTYGYDPLNPGMPGGSSMVTIIPNSGTTACGYNTSGLQGLSHSSFGVFPDSTPYKQTASELRQYIINLEATRRLKDLADVNFTRSPVPGDIIAYNYTTGLWELLDFVSGGEF
jgi:hypothetical protein